MGRELMYEMGCEEQVFDERNEFYSEEEVECLLEDDLITGAEQGFMEGYIGAARGKVV